MTAVDFIVQKLNSLVNAMPNDIYSTICNIMLEAKKMEKEQIEKAFNDGYCKGDLELTKDDIKQYYNETYNK
jgi:hypothetical protein